MTTIEESANPTVSTTRFGDTLVNSNGTHLLPKEIDDIDLTTKNCIFIGYEDKDLQNLRDVELLYNSKKYGNLFATKTTKNIHPMLEDDYMLGSCMVVFVEHKNETYVILVQVKGRSYVMNPAGHRKWDESYEDCAKRETKEETGLDIIQSNPLAELTFSTGFGGLKWTGKTVAFYGYAKCPEEWNLNQDELNKIPSDDDDVDFLLACNINKLDQSGLDGHHLQLVQVASRQMQSDKMTKPPYLDSLKWICEQTT